MKWLVIFLSLLVASCKQEMDPKNLVLVSVATEYDESVFSIVWEYQDNLRSTFFVYFDPEEAFLRSATYGRESLFKEVDELQLFLYENAGCEKKYTAYYTSYGKRRVLGEVDSEILTTLDELNIKYTILLIDQESI